MAKKILILTGGPIKKLDVFVIPINKLGIDATLASFYDIHFVTEGGGKLSIQVGEKDLKDFDLIYLRIVGKRLEDATLVVNYAKENGIRLIDRVYEDSFFIPSTISKAMEMKKLAEAGINLPATYFGRLSSIAEDAPKLLGFPLVIKSTSGRKARDAWLLTNNEEIEKLTATLREREKKGDCFFAQKLVGSSQRVRVLVVGDKVLGAITRPTKWRKTFLQKQGKQYSEEIKKALKPVPSKYSELAIKATRAAELDIAGVDILEDDNSHELFVIEANAAPAWNLIKRDCGVEVEEEILKFLVNC